MSDEYQAQDDEVELIYIADDEGNEEPFEVIMRFELDDGTDRKYLMVVPASDEDGEDGEDDEEDDSKEVFPFRYEEENGEIKLYPVEEGEEWDMVEETFNTLMDEFGDGEADAEGDR